MVSGAWRSQSVWGVLPKDAEIAHDLRFVGALIVAASVCMGWWALATSGTAGNAEYGVASAAEEMRK